MINKLYNIAHTFICIVLEIYISFIIFIAIPIVFLISQYPHITITIIGKRK